MQAAPPESGAREAGGRTPEGVGLPEGILRYIGSLVRHLEALGSLAMCEAKEAGEVYLRVAVFLFFAVFFLAFGYVFLILAVVFLIHFLLGVEWVWIVLLMAVAHGALVALCLFAARHYFRTPVFEHTAAELRKDSAALRGQATPPPMP